jgi:hypothetical protein
MVVAKYVTTDPITEMDWVAQRMRNVRKPPGGVW